MTTTIKAIKTHYKGCHFDSRLEARWAVFFDSLGIEWQYEPETLTGVFGDRYTPDFFLPNIKVEWFGDSINWLGGRPDSGIYVEVKGNPRELGSCWSKLEGAIDFGGPCSNGLLVLGDVPFPDETPLHSVLWNYKGVVKAVSAFEFESECFDKVRLSVGESSGFCFVSGPSDLEKVISPSNFLNDVRLEEGFKVKIFDEGPNNWEKIYEAYIHARSAKFRNFDQIYGVRT